MKKLLYILCIVGFSNAFAEDLTITGADWNTDASWNDAPYLTCIAANSDYAENVAVSAISGTTTFGIIVKPVASTSFHFPIALADKDVERDFYNIKWSNNQFSVETNCDSCGGSLVTNTSSITITPGNYYLVLARVSESSVDISINGSAWSTKANNNPAGTNAAIDTVSLCRRGDSTPSGYFDGDIYAAFVHRGSWADPSLVWNSGDPWSVLGIESTDNNQGNPPKRAYWQSTGILE